jgi:molybdopterin-guanine dinucleotide biosynthesis protein A
MGRDKVRLPFQGGPLAEFVARAVESAAGSAALVGDPALYGEFGYQAVADLYPGEGPLGGILTTLDHTRADWNLVVACDMPGLTAGFLSRILDAAEQSGRAALMTAGPSGCPEPLCAVYNRRARPEIEAAFPRGERKITAAMAGLGVEVLAVAEVAEFQNVNTPEDWADYVAE